MHMHRFSLKPTAPYLSLKSLCCRGLEGVDPSVCTNVLFICGMSARGRTEFFQPIVSHLSALTASPPDPGPPLLT